MRSRVVGILGALALLISVAYGSGFSGGNAPPSINAVSGKFLRTSNLALTSGGFTPITLTSEAWKNYLVHDTGTNPERITVSYAGVYHVSVCASFQASALGLQRSFYFVHKNSVGTVVDSNQVDHFVPSYSPTFEGDATFRADVGDWFEIQAYQDIGSNLNLTYARVAVSRVASYY